eukprot:scaffold425887_cov36-Prasinocladus_malaysianus.AAC.1
MAVQANSLPGHLLALAVRLGWQCSSSDRFTSLSTAQETLIKACKYAASHIIVYIHRFEGWMSLAMFGSMTSNWSAMTARDFMVAMIAIHARRPP